jgi:hypothetical protein
MRREDLIESLARLGYALIEPRTKEMSGPQIGALLGGLAGSKEPRLIEGFPVVLANCAHRGIRLDWDALLAANSRDRDKSRSLEKLVLLSWDLLDSEGLERPVGLESVVDSLRSGYGDLLVSDTVKLESGVSLSTERLRNALRRYAADLATSTSTRERAQNRQLRSFQLNLRLSTLFPPKQKELVLKKLKGEAMTKTEQEYYSRVVKKKLEALADNDLRKIALTLIKK